MDHQQKNVVKHRPNTVVMFRANPNPNP